MHIMNCDHHKLSQHDTNWSKPIYTALCTQIALNNRPNYNWMLLLWSLYQEHT